MKRAVCCFSLLLLLGGFFAFQNGSHVSSQSGRIGSNSVNYPRSNKLSANRPSPGGSNSATSVKEPTSSLKLATSFQQPQKYGWHVVNVVTGKLNFVGQWLKVALSPTGEYIAIGDFKRPTYTIYVKKLPDGPLKMIGLYTPADEDSRPELNWGADSASVVMSDENGLKSFDSDIIPSHMDFAIGDQQRPLSNEASGILNRRFDQCWNVVYSPGNEWVAASCAKGDYKSRNFSGGIFVFRRDGSRLTQITKNVSIKIKDGDDRDISWLPDGTTLFFRRTIFEDEGT